MYLLLFNLLSYNNLLPHYFKDINLTQYFLPHLMKLPNTAVLCCNQNCHKH